jgi:selenide,water dikinase
MDTADGLMAYSKLSGCGAKLGPSVLEEALCGLRQAACPDLLAGFEHAEDAGIYRLDDERALVQTVDFFPPIVPDPRLFGRIAAANALSDVYAMGGRPLTALALICHPMQSLGMAPLKAMMEGGLEALGEAGCSLVGGHSIDDEVPKLGYAITGIVHPERFWRNNSLKIGAVVILTKPLGTGIVNCALRAGVATVGSIEAAQSSMARLNRRAAEILASFSVQACTDVTGFGLGGHAAEMASGGRAGLRIRMSSLLMFPSVLDYIAGGHTTDGAGRNKAGRLRFMRGVEAIDPALLELVFDPQTSGGLLAAVPASEGQPALEALRREGLEAALIGESTDIPGEVELVS